VPWGSAKGARHLGTRYPLVVGKPRSGGLATIEYCPVDEVLGGVLAKPLQGPEFVGFRNATMGCTGAGHLGYKLKLGGLPKGCKVHTGPWSQFIYPQLQQETNVPL